MRGMNGMIKPIIGGDAVDAELIRQRDEQTVVYRQSMLHSQVESDAQKWPGRLYPQRHCLQRLHVLMKFCVRNECLHPLLPEHVRSFNEGEIEEHDLNAALLGFPQQPIGFG